MHLLWSSECVEIYRTQNLSRGITVSAKVKVSMMRTVNLGMMDASVALGEVATMKAH
jgi:hypothetical protein